MIYKPLNDFMIESGLKNSSWDGPLINWLNKNYPQINLKNDSNLWQSLNGCGDIVTVYKEIKLFLSDEIKSEDNFTRLKNLICTNCFGINIETADYLVDEMSKYLGCFSIPELSMYDSLKMISNTSNRDILISYNERLENTSLPIISSIQKTLVTNYKRLLVNSINMPIGKIDKSSYGIRVHYLNNEKFQAIVGVVSAGKINSANKYKEKQGFTSYLKNLSSNLSNNPGILSANLINDEYIGLFDDGDIIFGYEYIPIKKVLGMNTGDCFKKLDKKLMLGDMFFDNPKSLLKHMSSNAVEVLIEMQPEAILPSYIIAIDELRENDVEAAKLLSLPIYVVNSNSCYNKRLAIEESIKSEIKDITDKGLLLRKLVKLYKYQEQSYLINTGCFANYKNDIVARLDETYKSIGELIKEIYNSCALDDNLPIRERFSNMELLILLNTVITDMSLTNSLNSKRIGDIKNFKCFFTEYGSHSEFMNDIISKIENKFNSKISTYALLCLASLSCNVQDYNLKICYEEFNRHALEFLTYFKFEYMDLVLDKSFANIENYSNALVYKDNILTVLLENDRLKTIIKNGVRYYISIENTSPSKFGNKIKTSYICKNLDNKELEVRILKNGDIKVIDRKSYIIKSNQLKTIENKEYVIN